MKKNIIFILFISGFIFQSCSNGKKENTASASGVRIDQIEGSCPYLTNDNEGNIVLSWIRKMDSTKLVYCYAVSKDKGISFGKVIEIPASGDIQPHGENMPKIIFKPTGEIITAWPVANVNPKNPYSDLVYYSISNDKGNTWSKPEKLVKDTASYDQRYFDMAILKNGEAGITWLDNRKKTDKDGSGLFLAETNADKGFGNEKMISESCCQCCRTDMFIDNKKNIHLLYRSIINDSIRDMVHTVSTDGGKTFTAPERISKDNWVINGCPHTGPAMTENKNGIQFAWFTGGNKAGVYYCNSTDDGISFSKREIVSGEAARHCQITSIDNENIVIVWNENFIKDNIVSSRIGMEIRDPSGKELSKQFITPENGNATFPVIKVIGKNTVLIAYTDTEKNKDHVEYKIVEL